jgi:hypothetical protein
MRSVVRSIGIAAGFVLLAGIQHASAQIVDTVEFTTAFPFTVGLATVPAGTYTITPDEDNPNILQLRGAHTGVFFETTDVPVRQSPAKTEILFKRYGNAYVLKDVYVEGSATAVESMTAEGERHIAKKSALATEYRITGIRISQTFRKSHLARK